MKQFVIILFVALLAGCASMRNPYDGIVVLRDGEAHFLSFDVKNATLLDTMFVIEDCANHVLPKANRITLRAQIWKEQPNVLLTEQELRKEAYRDTRHYLDAESGGPLKYSLPDDQSPSLRSDLDAIPRISFVMSNVSLASILDEISSQTGLRWKTDSKKREYLLYDPKLKGQKIEQDN